MQLAAQSYSPLRGLVFAAAAGFAAAAAAGTEVQEADCEVAAHNAQPHPVPKAPCAANAGHDERTLFAPRCAQ